MIKGNFHTHSVFSDGKNTIEEIIETAINKGFLSIGISDHSYTEFDDCFCMKKDDFDSYIAKMNEVKVKYGDKIDILTGMEFDFYSTDVKRELLDYTVGSVHYVKKNGIYYGVDHSPDGEKQGIDEGCGGDVHAYIKEYYNSLCQHVTDNKIDIVGHFDVLAKFGLIDEDEDFYRKAAIEAADYIVERGVVIEINTGAVFKKLKDHPYPNFFILKRICEKGGNVIIDSDSHMIGSLDFYFDESAQLMREAGFKNTVRLTSNGFVEEPLI